MTLAWGLLAAAALLWPDRLASSFDGIPLDGAAEAIVIGVAVPTLLCVHPAFVRTRFARIAIVSLLAWKAFGSAALVQEGWCVRVQPERPYARDQTGAPHAWDVRADWRSPDPRCSAIMTRAYTRLEEFPVWFFNLPPATDRPIEPEDRPPAAATTMTVMGFMRAGETGILGVDHSDAVAVTMSVDGGPEVAGVDEARVDRGTHTVSMTARLAGNDWRFAPRWNGVPAFAAVMATVRRAGPLDVVAARVRCLPALVALGFIGAWIASFLRNVGDVVLVAWSAAASAALAWLVFSDQGDLARWALAGLALAGLLPIAERNRNGTGAFLAVGLPWLAYVVARAAPSIGRLTLYEWGDDFFTFQRYAYRIALQGYWLEGGSPTFWFQPLYRWIAAALHLVFGDSSAGEAFWDGACLLAGSLWVFHIVRTRSAFGWSVAAAAIPLATFMLGTPRGLIGRGLGEISSAGFIYMAAAMAMRAPSSLSALAGAGVCAVLGFYTRLNNLPMAAGVAAFAIPPDVRAADAIRVREWVNRVSWRAVAGIAGALAFGAVLFATRTWHFTGVFSV